MDKWSDDQLKKMKVGKRARNGLSQETDGFPSSLAETRRSRPSWTATVPIEDIRKAWE